MRSVTKVVPLILFTVVVGCGHDVREPGTGDIDLDLHIDRLDRDLFHAAPDPTGTLGLKMQARYGEFWRVYIEDILQAAAVDDPRLPVVLTRFTMDPDWRDAQAAVDSVLGDLEPQCLQFEEAFERLAVFFPERPTPRIVGFNAGFNYGIYPTDSVLGVGLEWFIGPEQPVIAYLATESFPQFVKDRMIPDMLVPSSVKGWLLVHYMRDTRGTDLLTNLVETGKVMALLDALLPEADPSLKFAFTPAQLAWCEANEYTMWKELVSKEMLYSKKEEDIGRIMNDAPFTNGFPRESPGHVGEWIGYRMVKSYLDENPRMTFADLFAMVDPLPILKTYKPR